MSDLKLGIEQDENFEKVTREMQEQLEQIRNNPQLRDLDVRCTGAYKQSRAAAEKMAQDPDKMKQFLDNLEQKLNEIPKIGGYLANIPVLADMVRSYCVGEYRQLPIASLVGILTALLYFVLPFDILPDFIPGIGQLDDALVIAVTMAFIKADVATYKQWRAEQGKLLDADAEIK